MATTSTTTSPTRARPELQPPSPGARRPTLPTTLPTNLPMALAFLVFLLLELGVVSTAHVSSINMFPSLAPEDRVLVHRFSRSASPGDVLVYHSPFGDDHLQLGRVVAIAGQSVELDEQGLHVDGNLLTTSLCEQDDPEEDPGATGNEECPDPPCPATPCLFAVEKLNEHPFFVRPAGLLSGLFFLPRIVPEGHVFVLSDNRVDERDSRIYGAIPLHEIVGVASFIYYARDESGIRWDRISLPVS